MAIPVRSNTDFGSNQLQNIVIHVLSSDPGSPTTGQLWFNSTSHVLKVYDGTTVQTLGELSNTLNNFATPTGTLSMGSQVVSNVASPSASTDAANKAYVDASAYGLDVKMSVRCAATANIAIATALVNGSSVDGVTVATGDRVLLAHQTTTTENGVYIVVASGAAPRSTDLNSSANYNAGDFVFVEQGTTNATTGWIATTQGTYTIGSTSITWTQMAGGTSYTAGSGLTLTGASFAVNTDATTIAVISSNLSVKSSATAGQSMISQGSGAAAWGALALATAGSVSGQLPIANGGTSGTTAATARTALGCTTKFAANIGDGSTTSIAVTHSLGTQDLVYGVYLLSGSNDYTLVEVQNTSTSVMTFVFSVAPATNAYRVIIIG